MWCSRAAATTVRRHGRRPSVPPPLGAPRTRPGRNGPVAACITPWTTPEISSTARADENDEASGAQANGVRYCQVDYSSSTAAPTKRPTPPITQPQTRPQPHRESNHEPDHEPANPTPHGQLHRQPHVRSNLHELAELGAIDLGSRTPAWSRVQRINQRFDRSRVRRSSRGGSCSAGRKVRSGRLRVRL